MDTHPFWFIKDIHDVGIWLQILIMLGGLCISLWKVGVWFHEWSFELKHLEKQLQQGFKDNESSHQEIISTIKSHTEKIEHHGVRITILEHERHKV